MIPNVNLVTNIGFGAEATHTKKPSPFANLPTKPMHDIAHPAVVERNTKADEHTDELMFSRARHISFLKRLSRKLRRFRRAA